MYVANILSHTLACKTPHTKKKQNEQTSARYYKRGAQQNHLCDVFVTAPAVPRQTRRRRATICSNAHAQRAHARRFFFARIVGFNFQRARASAAIRTLRGAQLFITSHQTPTHTHRPNGQTRRHQRAPAPVPALQLI